MRGLATRTNERHAVLAAGMAVVLFAPLFRWGLARPTVFWWWMSGLLLLLNIAILIARPDLRRQLGADFRTNPLKKLMAGTVSAAGLYLVFFLGRALLSALLPDSEQHISSVYLLRSALPSWFIALLLIAIIGPGEEIFWRVFLHQTFRARYGARNGLFLTASLYAAVHAGSGNPVLIVAALTAGLFWGWLYSSSRSAFVIISSHVVWDLSVFLVAPFS